MNPGARNAPNYGEVWLIDVSGNGTQPDLRPCVIVSSDALRELPVRLVARIDEPAGHAHIWRVEIPAEEGSGIAGRAVADAMGLQSVELARCVRKIGSLSADVMAEIAAAIAIVVEFEG